MTLGDSTVAAGLGGPGLAQSRERVIYHTLGRSQGTGQHSTGVSLSDVTLL